MLTNEKDLQAVIVATPDFWQRPITNAYPNMAQVALQRIQNTPAAAKSMVLAARKPQVIAIVTSG